MGAKTKRWPASSIALVIAAVLLIGTGGYFLVFRSPLLPEDMRYIGWSGQFDTVRPSLESWLAQVLRVMGGYVVGTWCSH